MAQSKMVAVTGATGHVGRLLVEQLLRSGTRVRAIARDSGKLASLRNKGAEIWAGDLDDTEFLTKALTGAEAAFVMIPPYVTAADHRAARLRTVQSLKSALERSRMKRAVVLSSIGAGLPAGTGPISDLHELEEALKKVEGLATVSLRPGFFMENYLGSIGVIKKAGINGSATSPDVPIPTVATRDIAETATTVLSDSTFSGHSVHDLLGARDYTPREATAILGAAIGQPELAYVQFPEGDFKSALMSAGLSESTADSFIEMSRAMNDGSIQATVSRTPDNTTPTTLDVFAKAVFAPVYKATN